jgi:hypothetical protein
VPLSRKKLRPIESECFYGDPNVAMLRDRDRPRLKLEELRPTGFVNNNGLHHLHAISRRAWQFAAVNAYAAIV